MVKLKKNTWTNNNTGSPIIFDIRLNFYCNMYGYYQLNSYFFYKL